MASCILYYTKEIGDVLPTGHFTLLPDDADSERNKKLQFVRLELGSLTELLKLTCCARRPFPSPFHCWPTN